MGSNPDAGRRRPDERPSPVRWPDGRSFAFTIFDDPDAQSFEDGQVMYEFLADRGFRTTRGVWPAPAVRTPNSGGETCDRAAYRRHTQGLQALGFEVGYHNATKHSSTRAETIRGLDAFKDYFGHDPSAMANHYNEEAIYWGDARLSPPWRSLYRVATRWRTSGVHFGEVAGHTAFWGDVCRQRIRYCRNFVFADINTLAACPWMPYHDLARPFVPAWYASSEASNADRLIATLSEANQDRLEAQGGACIIYSHFGHGYVQQGAVHARVATLLTRLSRKNGWFVPVSTLLDHLRTHHGDRTITDAQRRTLERRWLVEKFFRGTS